MFATDIYTAEEFDFEVRQLKKYLKRKNAKDLADASFRTLERMARWNQKEAKDFGLSDRLSTLAKELGL
jgi:hypothetical protein